MWDMLCVIHIIPLPMIKKRLLFAYSAFKSPARPSGLGNAIYKIAKSQVRMPPFRII